MSSLSSGINSISTVVITDFVERFQRVRNSAFNLKLAKFLAAAIGLIGIGIALLVFNYKDVVQWNLIELIARMNHLFVAPLGVLFFVGILSRRVGGLAAIAGFWVGVLAAFAISFSGELFGRVSDVEIGAAYKVTAPRVVDRVRIAREDPQGGWIGKDERTGAEVHIRGVDSLRHPSISFTWIMPGAFLASLASSFALGYLFKPPKPSQLGALYAFGSKGADPGGGTRTDS
jgi:Na+/proline symporter